MAAQLELVEFKKNITFVSVILASVIWLELVEFKKNITFLTVGIQQPVALELVEFKKNITFETGLDACHDAGACRV